MTIIILYYLSVFFFVFFVSFLSSSSSSFFAQTTITQPLPLTLYTGADCIRFIYVLCIKHIINNFQVSDRLAQVGSFNFWSYTHTHRERARARRVGNITTNRVKLISQVAEKERRKKLSITYWFALESGPKNANNKPCFGL